MNLNIASIVFKRVAELIFLKISLTTGLDNYETENYIK